MDHNLTLPNERSNQIGLTNIEKDIRQKISNRTLSHGWIICGPEGIGRATLAFRIARALLAPEALTDEHSLNMDASERAFRLIAAKAHPDLFVAERLWDEKKSRYQSEITVETVRELNAFLNRTASGKARVAIIDTADDMNRNAANALLKVLEEPPSHTLILLLSASPGRLLPTIRSRCRKIGIPRMSDEEIRNFLNAEGIDAETAATVTPFAKGRPGYALSLAESDGFDAIKLSRQFLTAAREGQDLSKVIAGVSGKSGEGRWPVFCNMVLSALSNAAREIAADNEGVGTFKNVPAEALLMTWEKLTLLVERGDTLNLDRAQVVHAMAYDLRSTLQNKVA
ncbi:DNA polymerase III subunit delta' [Hyphococcus flavus]|uniref:DNA polymerase III subunit delta n=1 Tax=Hyphococcus flavus TaxID=1866326 RepID=A0AAE9ZAZ5_9PROT|nr:DNA polymerase III subunit delta' [Hyphococcus flavus]WDI31054.1 DNA polymerase III subunit delta' [Hyphococcus flavus]